MKATVMNAIRLLALIVFYFFCFVVVSAALLPSSSEQAQGQPSASLVPLLTVSVLNTLVLSYVILRSRWTGWKLVIAIFFIFYGVTTVMTQIETAVFITNLPPGMLRGLFVSGAIIAAMFSALAVLILGKRKSYPTESNIRARLDMSVGEWVGKLSLIVIAYVIIYFTFGYYIAWKNEALRSYYGGSDPGSFLAQIRSVMRETPWLFPFQAMRAILWTVIAVPVIRMMKGQWWETGLAVALLFGVVTTSPLLLPNPLMPQEVRMVHLLETATSNFLFGWLVVLLLGWRDSVRK
jgi:hypothetical protein